MARTDGIWGERTLIDRLCELVSNDGDIDLPEASCRLDGCVKVWALCVDDLRIEVNRLLACLGDNHKRKERMWEEEKEQAISKRRREDYEQMQRPNRTLVSSFSALRVQNFELKHSVDPIFRQLCAEFDRVGAQALLLNRMSIDAHGRVALDGCYDGEADAVGRAETETLVSGSDGEKMMATESTGVDRDVLDLGLRFFSELNVLDAQEICPSLKQIVCDRFESPTSPAQNYSTSGEEEEDVLAILSDDRDLHTVLGTGKDGRRDRPTALGADSRASNAVLDRWTDIDVVGESSTEPDRGVEISNACQSTKTTSAAAIRTDRGAAKHVGIPSKFANLKRKRQGSPEIEFRSAKSRGGSSYTRRLRSSRLQSAPTTPLDDVPPVGDCESLNSEAPRDVGTFQGTRAETLSTCSQTNEHVAHGTATSAAIWAQVPQQPQPQQTMHTMSRLDIHELRDVMGRELDVIRVSPDCDAHPLTVSISGTDH
jgi:hypothetical protein